MDATDRLPPWFRLTLAITGSGAVWLVGRLVWEQTVLSWRHGPQMVGFSLVHAELGLFLLLLLSSILFVVALVGALFASVVARWRRRPVSIWRWLGIAAGFAVLGLQFVPYTTWQRIFSAKIVAGPHASDFFTYAAAVGDLETVKVFVDRGLDVDSRNRDGSTALHGAAVEGQLAVLQYLISRGADPGIRNNFGHTALDNAREMKRHAAVQFLETQRQR